MARILLAGTILLEKQYFVDRISQANEVAFSTKINTLTSSKVINAGRVLSHSHKIEILGSIGQDEDGQLAIKHLKKYGIQPNLVESNQSPTGQVLVQTDKMGKSAVTLFLGGSTDFSLPINDVLSQFDYVYLETSFPLEMQYQLIEKTVNSGVRVFIDFPNQQKEFNKKYLRHATFVVPNRQEAEALLDRKIITIPDAFKAISSLQAHTDGHAIITLDADGCIIFDGQPIHLPAPKVSVKDSTAAGDIYRGVLLHYYLASNNLRLSAQKATEFASQSIEITGVNQSIETIKSKLT